jgi:hypothetical protein
MNPVFDEFCGYSAIDAIFGIYVLAYQRTCRDDTSILDDGSVEYGAFGADPAIAADANAPVIYALEPDGHIQPGKVMIFRMEAYEISDDGIAAYFDPACTAEKVIGPQTNVISHDQSFSQMAEASRTLDPGIFSHGHVVTQLDPAGGYGVDIGSFIDGYAPAHRDIFFAKDDGTPADKRRMRASWEAHEPAKFHEGAYP